MWQNKAFYFLCAQVTMNERSTALGLNVTSSLAHDVFFLI